MGETSDDLLGLYGRLTDAARSEHKDFLGLSLDELASLVEGSKMWLGTVHDLKNQFGIAAAHLAYLIKHGGMNDLQKENVETVLETLEHSKKILEEAIKIMRGDPPSKEDFQIHSILEKAIMDVKKYLGFVPQEFRFEADFNPGLPKVNADRLQMERVFFNLIRNAVEAIKESGVGNAIRITTAFQSSELRISVSDNGPGLPTSILAHTDPGHPLVTTRRARGGTGLGLMIVHQLIKAHGGRVKMRNKPEGGAEFVVFLPVTSSTVQS